MTSRHPNLHWPCHPHPPSVAPFSSFLSPLPHRDCATFTSQNCTLLLLPLCSTVSQPRHPHPSRITPLSSLFSSLLWHCHNHPFLPPLCPSSSPHHCHHLLTPPRPLFSTAPPLYSLKSIILIFHFFSFFCSSFLGLLLIVFLLLLIFLVYFWDYFCLCSSPSSFNFLSLFLLLPMDHNGVFFYQNI